MTLYSNFKEKHGDFIESILECKAKLHIASEGLNSLSEETNKNLSIQTTIKKQSPSCVVTECYVEVIIMCDDSIFHRINEIMGQQGFELDEEYSGKMKFIYKL